MHIRKFESIAAARVKPGPMGEIDREVSFGSSYSLVTQLTPSWGMAALDTCGQRGGHSCQWMKVSPSANLLASHKISVVCLAVQVLGN